MIYSRSSLIFLSRRGQRAKFKRCWKRIKITRNLSSLRKPPKRSAMVTVRMPFVEMHVISHVGVLGFQGFQFNPPGWMCLGFQGFQFNPPGWMCHQTILQQLHQYFPNSFPQTMSLNPTDPTELEIAMKTAWDGGSPNKANELFETQPNFHAFSCRRCGCKGYDPDCVLEAGVQLLISVTDRRLGTHNICHNCFVEDIKLVEIAEIKIAKPSQHG